MQSLPFPGGIGVRVVSRGACVLGCSMLSGCALMVGDIADDAYTAAFRTDMVDTSALSPDELQQLPRVQSYGTDAGVAYASLGQFEGLSCRETIRWVPVLSETNGLTPEAVAMTQLKVKAIKAGGDAIRAPTCVYRSTMDWKNNCFASWVCSGEAIRVAH